MREADPAFDFNYRNLKLILIDFRFRTVAYLVMTVKESHNDEVYPNVSTLQKVSSV